MKGVYCQLASVLGTVGVDLDHQADVVLVWFPTVKLLAPPHIGTLWKEGSMDSPHLRGGALRCPSLEGRAAIHYLEFHMRDFSLSPYLLIRILILAWIWRYEFYKLGNPILPDFMA